MPDGVPDREAPCFESPSCCVCGTGSTEGSTVACRSFGVSDASDVAGVLMSMTTSPCEAGRTEAALPIPPDGFGSVWLRFMSMSMLFWTASVRDMAATKTRGKPRETCGQANPGEVSQTYGIISMEKSPK